MQLEKKAHQQQNNQQIENLLKLVTEMIQLKKSMLQLMLLIEQTLWIVL
jgi:hypothetical protein